jgi:uncharacterized membrane protein
MTLLSLSHFADSIIGGVNLPDLTSKTSDGSLLQTALSFTFELSGAIAFLIITIAGLMYVTSQGDSGRITKARNTIVYALVGLVISIAGTVIVRYVIGASK